jgi:hypothetical protein
MRPPASGAQLAAFFAIPDYLAETAWRADLSKVYLRFWPIIAGIVCVSGVDPRIASWSWFS